MATLSQQDIVRTPSQTTAPSLRRNFAWTFAGNFVYAASSWAMLVVLAKLGTPEMVGQFALGLAVTAPVILFATLQLRAIQATDANHEHPFADYFGLRLVMMVLALVFIAAIVEISGFPRETALSILVIGFGKAIDAISDVIYGLLEQHEQKERIAVSMMLRGVLSLIALAAGLYLTHSVLLASVGWALASLVVLAFFDFRSGEIILSALAQESKAIGIDDWLLPRFTFSTFLKLTRLALPLGVTVMLISLNTNIPRYFLERYSGERDLGIFAAISYLMVAGATLMTALGQSASPRLAKQFAAQDRAAFGVLLLKLLGIGGVLGGLGVGIALLAGRPILTVLYQPEYASYVDVFAWVMLASALLYMASFFGYGVTAARDFKVQPLIYGICAVSSIAFCVLLIPQYGIQGAAWATILASALQLAFLSFYVVRVLRKPGAERVARD